MNNSFDFCVKTKVKFGCGVRCLLTELIKTEKWHKIGVVVDHNLLNLPMVKDLLHDLDDTTREFVLGPCTISEPTYDSLEEMRQI